MAEITAGMVRALRDKTDAPMMECKKALTEANGDLDKAEEILRVKLGNKATKAASRVAAEGIVSIALASDAKAGAIVEVNCETDFVARSDEFQAFAKAVAAAALKAAPSSLEDLLKLSHEGSTLDERRRALIAKIGENMAVRRFVRVASPGPLGTYIHGARIGSLAALQGGDEALARDIAMHVAAVNPAYIDVGDVPPELLQKEREILTEQTKGEKKPPEIIAKMVEGRLRKYLAEITLVGQPFIKDEDMTVEKLLKKAGAKVTMFARYEVGAGIEKKQDDFVGEVMAQVKAQEKH
jgi:elongation factor Ts